MSGSLSSKLVQRAEGGGGNRLDYLTVRKKMSSRRPAELVALSVASSVQKSGMLRHSCCVGGGGGTGVRVFQINRASGL